MTNRARPLRDGLARLPRWQRGGLVLLPLALIGAVGAKLAGHDQAVAAAPPPPAVTVATPLVRDVSEWDDYVGRFEPSQTRRDPAARRRAR